MKLFYNLTTLDKFILKQVLEVFLLGVVVFTSIMFASETFISLVKQISDHGMPFNIAIMIIFLNLPAVIVKTIPMSVLFATVMTINKMCLQSELTILKACGISIKRISKPIFLFSVVMTLLTFIINETIVPLTTSQSKTLALYAITQKNIPEGKRHFNFNELKKGNKLKRLFYVEKCEDKKFSNVTIVDLSDERQVQILQAKNGTSVPQGWQFNNASIYTISIEEKTLNTSWVEKTIIDFGSDIQKQLEKKDDGSDLNLTQLLPYLDKNNKTKVKPKILAKYKVCFWDKLALPLITIVFVLLGIPLAITPPRVRHNRGFLFTIAILFLYFLIRTFSVSLGYNNTIPAFLAANMPNFILGLLGYILFVNKSNKI